MRVIAWDSETSLIRPALQSPPMTCGQWCEIFPGGTLGRAYVQLPEEFLPNLIDWLADDNVLLVGAETAFDVLVPCYTLDTTSRHLAQGLGLDTREPGADLLTRFVRKYDLNLVTDIFVRQKLIDLARGCYRYERSDDGQTVVGLNKYNLGALAKRIAGIEIPEENKKCHVCDNTGCPHCPWRLRYAELRDVPVDQWPREAYDYAALDAVATASVWVGQWKPSLRIEQNFPGVTVADALAQEFEECRAALALKAMSAYGLRTDPAAVAQFEAQVRAAHAETAEELVGWGLLRRKYKRDLKAMQQYLTRAGLADHFCRYVPDAPPAFSFAARCYESAIAKADPTVRPVLIALSTDQFSDPALLALGLTYCDETRNTKAAASLLRAAWPDAPRNDVTPAEKIKAKAEGREPTGSLKLDKDTMHLAADVLEGRIRSGEVPNAEQAQAAAEALRAYGELSHLSKQLGTDIPILKDGAIRPIHTRYETILETERTSSSKPNVQNQAQGNKSIGSRECFVPRKGWVLVDVDYGQLELFTLAQSCYWLLGYSALGEVLRSGKDPHTMFACEMLKISYEDGKARSKNKSDSEFQNARQSAKVLNFGRPGGLSAKTLQVFARKSYKVLKTIEEWKDLIDVWNATWSEMPAYFDYVNRLERYKGSGLFDVAYPQVKGYRAGSTYCSASNTFFQRLGAKVAKRALWYVFRASYTERESPLYGARPVLFVHDQIIAEYPENGNESAAAYELSRLMNQAGRELLPDCPVTCEPVLCRRWSKLAAETKDASGRLTAWEHPEA